MKHLVRLINRFRLYKKMKRSKKKHGALSFKVSNPIAFLADLEKAGIRYCVLRWPDRVPSGEIAKEKSNQQIVSEYGDIDILIEPGTNGRKKILDVGALHIKKTGISCDFYSTYGTGGFSYKRYPYFPPILAREILKNRRMDPRGFYRSFGATYINSLAYHILYHKAASNCPSFGSEGEKELAGYLLRLEEEAIKESVELPSPLSLESIYHWLRKNNFDMPYDLKVRWPHEGLLDRLINIENAEFATRKDNAEYPCIFMLREDLEDNHLIDDAIKLVLEKFTINQRIDIPKEDRTALARHLRGGNWVEGREATEILPCIMLICSDPAPIKPVTPDKAYPHLDNTNLNYKSQIRDQLSDRSSKKLYCIHSTDNIHETAYVLSILKKMGYLTDQKSIRDQ